MKLQETFSSPESRVPRAVMFIDLANSTEMKESHTEATWLTTLGWFYDLIATKVGSEYGGNIIKYTGDGAMIIFDTDHVAEAINAAIALQEAIREARHNHEVDCYATIGIATGRTVRFRHFQGQEDYVDAVVDLAARLCSAASSQAILVDTDTITHANMGKVVSQIGRLSSPPRSAQQYAGDAHTFEAKGFKNLVKYHQIFWADHTYGLKPEFVENNIRREVPEAPSSHYSPPSPPPRTPSMDEYLQEVSSLWQRSERQEALDLCLKLSKAGSSEADDLIFQMSQVLINEALPKDDKDTLNTAFELLKYAASEGHQGARDMMRTLRQ
jgi:class 3 adenylate cyclase